jgi:hypothetical protein
MQEMFNIYKNIGYIEIKGHLHTIIGIAYSHVTLGSCIATKRLTTSPMFSRPVTMAGNGMS